MFLILASLGWFILSFLAIPVQSQSINIDIYKCASTHTQMCIYIYNIYIYLSCDYIYFIQLYKIIFNTLQTYMEYNGICMYVYLSVGRSVCLSAYMHACMYVIILCKICTYVFICWDWLAQLLGQASHSWEKMDGFGTWSKASWTCWLSRLCDTEVKLDHHGEEAPSLVCQKQHLQSELL